MIRKEEGPHFKKYKNEREYKYKFPTDITKCYMQAIREKWVIMCLLQLKGFLQDILNPPVMNKQYTSNF